MCDLYRAKYSALFVCWQIPKDTLGHLLFSNALLSGKMRARASSFSDAQLVMHFICVG